MNFSVELYQVLMVLLPLLAAGIRFYSEIIKRQALHEAEIARLRSDLLKLREEVEELFTRLDKLAVSNAEIQASVREIKEMIYTQNHER